MKRVVGVLLICYYFLEKIIDFLQIIEYVGKLLPLGPFTSEILSPLLFAIGLLLVVDSMWPGFLVGLKMRIVNTDFEADIVGKRTVRLGEPLRFKVKYDGALREGCFTAKVTNAEGKLLPTTGKDFEWHPCYDTYDVWLGKGRIRGTRLYDYEWNVTIPLDYPTGSYDAVIVVLDQGEHVRETEPITFKVVHGAYD